MAILSHFYKSCNFFYHISTLKLKNIKFISRICKIEIKIVIMRAFNNLPIAVIDSGIGGLSVLDRLVKKFPFESFIYYGDNLFAPYGNKPLSFVKNRVFTITETLYNRGIKGIVLACNTVSTHFYKEIKNTFPFFVVPTVPPILSGNGVYLACTSNTASSNFVKTNYSGRVISFPCLAKTIEDNVFNLDSFNVLPYFSKLDKKVSVLVLGCTHYSFIKNNIHSALGITTVDGYDTILRKVDYHLSNNNAYSNTTQKITFVGEAKSFNKKVFERVFCHVGGHKT